MKSEVREGILVTKLFLPIKIEAILEKLDQDTWRLYYEETFDEETPEEAIEKGVKMLKRMLPGAQCARVGQTVSFKIIDSRDVVFGYLGLEMIGQSKIGKLTLAELLLLTSLARS